jgi:hypothetical protein
MTVATHFHVHYTYGSRTVIRDRVGCEMDRCECHYQDGEDGSGIEPQNVTHVEALLAARGCAWCGCGWQVQEH